VKPLYSATVGDLTPLDYLQVECVCGHVASVTAKDWPGSYRCAGTMRRRGEAQFNSELSLRPR
jgi:hypothetical protein